MFWSHLINQWKQKIQWGKYFNFYFFWNFKTKHNFLGYLENLFGSQFFVPLNNATTENSIFESNSTDAKFLSEYLRIIQNSNKNNDYADLSSFEKYLK